MRFSHRCGRMDRAPVFLRKRPFDLFELHLVHLVAERGGFSHAARVLGMNQSGISRAIQNIEARLETELFSRSTRRVDLTEAGRTFVKASHRILGEVDGLLDALAESSGVSSEICVGLSHSICPVYVPGFLNAYRRANPNTRLVVRTCTETDLVSGLESHRLDVALLPMAGKAPRGLRIAHAFEDRFQLICPLRNSDITSPDGRAKPASLRRWAATVPWILPASDSVSRQWVGDYFRSRKWSTQVAMEVGNFDLCIQLVAQGLGVAVVPIRSMAGHPARRRVTRLKLTPPLSRTLVAVVRTARKLPPHIENFVNSILF